MKNSSIVSCRILNCCLFFKKYTVYRQLEPGNKREKSLKGSRIQPASSEIQKQTMPRQYMQTVLFMRLIAVSEAKNFGTH